MSAARQQRAPLPMATCPTCRAYVAALHRAARAADHSRRAATPPPEPGRRFDRARARQPAQRAEAS